MWWKCLPEGNLSKWNDCDQDNYAEGKRGRKALGAKYIRSYFFANFLSKHQKTKHSHCDIKQTLEKRSVSLLQQRWHTNGNAECDIERFDVFSRMPHIPVNIWKNTMTSPRSFSG